jgi:hypothetical protein
MNLSISEFLKLLVSIVNLSLSVDSLTFTSPIPYCFDLDFGFIVRGGKWSETLSFISSFYSRSALAFGVDGFSSLAEKSEYTLSIGYSLGVVISPPFIAVKLFIGF